MVVCRLHSPSSGCTFGSSSRSSVIPAVVVSAVVLSTAVTPSPENFRQWELQANTSTTVLVLWSSISVVALDVDYHHNMLVSHQKVNPKEEGRVTPDNSIGRVLAVIINPLPQVTPHAFNKLVNDSLQVETEGSMSQHWI